jgi:hypothetical protein
VYIGCGVMQMLLAAMFALGPLGHAERYIAFAGPRGVPSQEPLPPQVTAVSGGPMTKDV